MQANHKRDTTYNGVGGIPLAIRGDTIIPPIRVSAIIPPGRGDRHHPPIKVHSYPPTRGGFTPSENFSKI